MIRLQTLSPRRQTFTYLAGPYSHFDQEVMMLRFKALTLAAGWLIKRGYKVFSPVTHSHPIAIENDIEVSFNGWKEFDLMMVDLSDSLTVVMLPGWRNSVGVLTEIKRAETQGKPITWLPVATFEPSGNLMNKLRWKM